MNLKVHTITGVHEQMARVKAESNGGFCTNYFRQEMTGSQILCTTTARTVVVLNDEHDFFRLYFFTTDSADFQRTLQSVEFPGETVTGYLTRSGNENVADAFQTSGFEPIATYRRMITYQLPTERTNAALEYATAADVDELYAGLFRSFDKYTDHLPTKDRLHRYVTNQWVIVNRNPGGITGALCFQLEGPKVNFNYVYSLTGNAVDLLRLQNNFYGIMRERGISAGFLWISETDNRLAELHRSMGWQFDGLKDHFYFRS